MSVTSYMVVNADCFTKHYYAGSQRIASKIGAGDFKESCQMNIEELYTTLKRMGVPEAWYSLDGSLLPDRTILYRNHNIWDVFYFDERGGINNINHFSNEEDACMYILNLLSREFSNSKLKKDINAKKRHYK